MKQERAPSPESVIFPAPLDDSRSLPRKTVKKPVKLSSKQPRMRKGLIADAPLLPDSIEQTLLQGIRMEAEFVFSAAQRTAVLPTLGVPKEPPMQGVVRPGGQKSKVVSKGKLEARSLWPQFRIEISQKEKAERLNMAYTSSVGLFPQGTQIRSRIKNVGVAIVWPDSRGYRVIPEAALSAFFREGRVDVTPPLPSSSQTGPLEKRLGRKARVQVIKNSLVELRLISVETLQTGGQLLCELLVSIGRVAVPQQYCSSQLVPVRAEYSFVEQESTAIFQVTKLLDVTKLSPAQFMIPPQLPIYKPAELPKRSTPFWKDAELRSLGFDSSSDELLLLTNQSLETLYVLGKKVPLAILEPGQQIKLPSTYDEKWSLSDLLGASRTSEVKLEQQSPWVITPGLEFNAQVVAAGVQTR